MIFKEIYIMARVEMQEVLRPWMKMEESAGI
jgi:hypothetical protein